MEHINCFSKCGHIDHPPLTKYVNANFSYSRSDLPHWFPVAGFQSVLNSPEVEPCSTPGFIRKISNVIQAGPHEFQRLRAHLGYYISFYIPDKPTRIAWKRKILYAKANDHLR
jgi:hypothetical protein